MTQYRVKVKPEYLWRFTGPQYKSLINSANFIVEFLESPRGILLYGSISERNTEFEKEDLEFIERIC